MRRNILTALAVCFALTAVRAETRTLAETERSDVPQTSPSGNLQARIEEPEASNDMLATVVIERGDETLIRQPLMNTMTSDFRALWSPDETLVAVNTSPYPRHYELFVSDLKKQKVIFSLEDDVATTWEQAAIDYFKTRAPDKCAGVDGLNILMYPIEWKNNRTLQVIFNLLGWNEGTAALPLGCSVFSDVLHEKGTWSLGPFYDYREESATD